MLEFSEEQLVEIVLVGAKRGYKQAAEDIERKLARQVAKHAQKGIDRFRVEALKVLRKRLDELKNSRSSELMISGFTEAIEHLEFGVESDWENLG